MILYIDIRTTNLTLTYKPITHSISIWHRNWRYCNPLYMPGYKDYMIPSQTPT